MKLRNFIGKCHIVCCLAMSISLSGCYLLPEEEEVVEIPELIETEEDIYQTVPVERGDIESLLICNITLEAKDTIIKSFTEGGKIAKLYVMKGDQVEEGDLLAELETIDYEKELAETKIAVEQRALDVERAKVLLQGKDETNIKTLKREIEELKEQNEELQKLLMLDEELLAAGSISQNEVEEIKNNIKDNERLIKDKNEEIENPDVSDKAVKEIQLKQAQLDYKGAQQHQEYLEEKVTRTKIYADCAGTITYCTNKSEGEFVSNEEKIYKIAKKGEKRICYQGNDIDKFSVGDRVTITADENNYEAEVIETPANVPFEVKSKEGYVPSVYLRFVDPSVSENFSIMPHIFNLTKLLDGRKNILRIPTTSIMYLDGKSYVYVLENEIRIQKPVITGLSTAAYTEVVSGLEEGELIILR